MQALIYICIFIHINIHIHILHILTISMVIFERLDRNIILRLMKSRRCLVVDENVIFIKNEPSKILK